MSYFKGSDAFIRDQGSAVNWTMQACTLIKKCPRLLFLIILTFFLLSEGKAFGFANITDIDKHKDLYNLTRSYLISDIREAEKYANQSLQLAREIDDPILIANSKYLLGLVNYFDGKLGVSTNYYRKALEYAESIEGEESYEIRESVWNNIGINEDISGRTQNTVEAYRNSIRYARLLNNNKGEAQTLINLALADMRIGIYDEAQQNLNKAREFFLAEQDDYHLGLIYQNYGMYFDLTRQPEQSLYMYNVSLDYFEKAGDYFSKRIVKQDMLRFHIEHRNQEKAETLIKKLMEDYTLDIHNFRDLPVMVALGLYEKIYGEPQKAVYFFEMAISSINSNEIRFNREILYLNLAEVYAETGEMEKFRNYLNSYWEIRNSSNQEYYEVRFLQFRDDAARDSAEARLQQYNSQFSSNFLFIMLIFATCVFILGAWFSLRKRRIKSSNKLNDTTAAPDRNELSTVSEPFPGLVSAQNNKAQQNGNQTLGNQPLDPPGVDVSENAINHKNPFLLNSVSEVADEDGEWDSISGDEKFEHLYQDILRLFEEKQLYKNSTLSITEVAHLLASNRKYVSKAINLKTGDSFTNFVNNYRISHAKLLLSKYGLNASSKMVAKSSGFGSVSTYHRVFKEYTKSTPNDWVKKQPQKS